MANYLLHLDPPYQHAGHYSGFVDTTSRSLLKALSSREEYHRSGRGSRLLKAAVAAGGTWVMVRVWPDGTRTDERRLKGHSSTRLCPLCSGPSAWNRGVLSSGIGTVPSALEP